MTESKRHPLRKAGDDRATRESDAQRAARSKLPRLPCVSGKLTYKYVSLHFLITKM